MIIFTHRRPLHHIQQSPDPDAKRSISFAPSLVEWSHSQICFLDILNMNRPIVPTIGEQTDPDQRTSSLRVTRPSEMKEGRRKKEEMRNGKTSNLKEHFEFSLRYVEYDTGTKRIKL